jgi:DNA-binding response OmpR family regulator
MKPERVLVIEPDALLRSLVAEWLEQVGIHAVFPIGGPCEANAAIGSVGAIVIDIPSPPCAGPVLLAWRRLFPQAAIIAASGRFLAGHDADDAMAGRLAVTKVLAKPYSRQQLYAALGVREQGASSHAPYS